MTGLSTRMTNINEPRPSPELVLAIIRETKLEPKFYELRNLKEQLNKEGFETVVYICISPEITLTKSGYPRKYSKLRIDLRDYNGVANCDHRMIKKYWEVNDRGNSWTCCFKCGFHKQPLVGRLVGFFKRLLTSKFPD